jgi:hypothetical protein
MKRIIPATLLIALSARAEVISSAGETKLLDAGVPPRRVLKLAAPTGAERLRVRIAAQMGVPPSPIGVELRVSPAGAWDWTVNATAVDLKSLRNSLFPSDPEKMLEVAGRIAKTLSGKFRSDERGRLYAFEWNVPNGGDEIEQSLRKGVAHTLSSLGEMVASLGEILPEGAVGAGARWRLSSRVRKEQGGVGVSMIVDGRYELVSLDDRDARLRLTARLSVPPIEIDAQRVAMTGDMTGSVRLDPARPLPKAVTLESTMNADIDGEKLTMRISAELELLK